MDRERHVIRSVFQVVEHAGGWRLLDNSKPILWFPEKATALETANVMAGARATFHGLPACVQALGDNGVMELVADYE